MLYELKISLTHNFFRNSAEAVKAEQEENFEHEIILRPKQSYEEKEVFV